MPNSFEKYSIEMRSEEYFKQCANLLRDYQFVYDFKVVDFFAERVWEKLPEEWIEFFESYGAHPLLNRLFDQDPKSLMFEKIPKSLQAFLADCTACSSLKFEPIRLSDPSLPSSSADNNPVLASIKTTELGFTKKQHEIRQLVPVLISLIEAKGCDQIIDIGCGLGHLIHSLKQECQRRNVTSVRRILGIESQSELCSKARITAAESSDCIGSVDAKIEYTNWMVGDDEESGFKLRQELSGYKESLIVSLHGCGDLQPTILRLLAKLTQTSTSTSQPSPESNPTSAASFSLIFLPCCYHKMSASIFSLSAVEAAAANWKSFPLSKTVREVIPACTISLYGLRLACQETIPRWRAQSDADHRYHRRNVAFNSLITLWRTTKTLNHRQEVDQKLSKSRRIKLPSDVLRTGPPTFSDKSAFMECLKLTDAAVDRSELAALFDEYEPFFAWIEPITALQFAMQQVLESVILEDRIAFIEETFGRRGLSPSIDPRENDGDPFQTTIRLVPVFDAWMSPRNMALIYCPSFATRCF